MSSTRARTRKALLAISMLAASAISLQPANADTFTPQNDPPVVTIVTVPNSMQPAAPRSTTTYEVTVTVGSQGTVENLEWVKMCFYEGLSDYHCANASTDPDTEFLMTWTEATNSYAVTGSNNHLNSGSTSDYGDGSGLTMDITFKFKISQAMIHSTNWNVEIWAMDDQAQSSYDSVSLLLDDSRSGVTVDYFGAVDTDRTSQAYGSLGYQGTSVVDNISTGAFFANGPSDISLSADNFTNGAATINLASGLPSSGEALLRCSPTNAFDGGSSAAITSTPTALNYFQFGGGTGEASDSSLVHSCELTYGGGATVANVLYSNTVTVAIGAS